jgi:hypothetical protein
LGGLFGTSLRVHQQRAKVAAVLGEQLRSNEVDFLDCSCDGPLVSSPPGPDARTIALGLRPEHVQ